MGGEHSKNIAGENPVLLSMKKAQSRLKSKEYRNKKLVPVVELKNGDQSLGFVPLDALQNDVYGKLAGTLVGGGRMDRGAHVDRDEAVICAGSTSLSWERRTASLDAKNGAEPIQDQVLLLFPRAFPMVTASPDPDVPGWCVLFRGDTTCRVVMDMPGGALTRVWRLGTARHVRVVVYSGEKRLGTLMLSGDSVLTSETVTHVLLELADTAGKSDFVVNESVCGFWKPTNISVAPKLSTMYQLCAVRQRTFGAAGFNEGDKVEVSSAVSPF